MKGGEMPMVSSLNLSLEEVKQIFEKFEKEQREQEKLKNTIAIFNPRKKIRIRKESNKNIRREDELLIWQYCFKGNDAALYDLIDYYTPFIKSMVWKPFRRIKGKAKRLYPLQARLNSSKTDKYEYQYISSLTHEIIAEALLEFCQLVDSYWEEKGSFSGYIRNFLPLRMENIFRQIIRDIDSIYLDGLPEENKDLYELRYLSCSIPEEEEPLQLENYGFTEKQRGVALLLSEGLNDSRIAEILGISRQAVIKHKNAIKKKMSKFQKTAS